MMPKIINYLIGSILIRVTGVSPERFINLCIAERIYLWNIYWYGNDIYAFIRLSDFFCIRPLVRKSRSRVIVVQRYGLPFIWSKIRERKILVLGSIMFFIMLYISTSYIWFIEISGLKTLSESSIRQMVFQQGLKPGSIKDSIDSRHLENDILIRFPEVAWVGITFVGTKAVIEIVEKTVARPEDKSPANVIAYKDGLITEIIVLAGQAVVKKGDTVKKDDILIRGIKVDIVPSGLPDQKQVNAVADQFIRAKGIVKARVWYESYREAELVRRFNIRTGRYSTELIVKVGEHTYCLNQSAAKHYNSFETEVIHKKLSWWRNQALNVEIIANRYFELAQDAVEISQEEARSTAISKALAEVQSAIPETAQVVSRKQHILQTTEANLVRAKVSVEVIEDIAQIKNME